MAPNLRPNCIGSGRLPVLYLRNNRADCPVCFTSVALTKHGLIRSHKYPSRANRARNRREHPDANHSQTT